MEGVKGSESLRTSQLGGSREEEEARAQAGQEVGWRTSRAGVGPVEPRVGAAIWCWSACGHRGCASAVFTALPAPVCADVSSLNWVQASLSPPGLA